MLSLQCDVNTAENLQGLRRRNELCDIVIVSSNGQQTHAHSCILTSHSTVIATVLQNRLSAQHDWSIFRPLVINIDEISINDSSPQDFAVDVNFLEILIRLMYGEVVDVASIHVPALNEYAHILGLSDQIFTSLIGNEEKTTQPVKCDESNVNELGVQKLVLSGDSQKKVIKEESYHVLGLNEIDLAKQIFPDGLSKSKERQPTDDYVIESFEGMDQPENVVSFSLSSENQDDSSSSKISSEGDLVYEKCSNVQSQDCNVIVGKVVEESNHHEEESAVGLISPVTKDRKGGSVHHVRNTKAYSGKAQQVQQHKKQVKKKSLICTVCGSDFQKSGDLVKHIKDMEHFAVQCPLCFMQVEDAEGQRLHFALHDQEFPFFCVYCDLRFPTRVALTMHVPKHMNSKLTLADSCCGETTSISDAPDEEIVYHVMDGGTQRAKRMLIDSKGYTYTVKRQKGDNTHWRCAVRSKAQHCKATVSQIGDHFMVGVSDHCHDAKQGGVTARILSKKVKQEACVDVKAAASTIVDKVVSECVNLEKLNYDVQFHNSLIRKANKIRKKMREDKSSGNDFELNLDFLPSSFLGKDLVIGNERHLIFATSTQLKLLATAKIWYLDGNCSVSCQPFVKILAIHTFLSSGQGMNQAPLSFVLMSRCHERDYKEVLAAILNNLPESPEVNTVIANFEKSLWHAVASTFPSKKLKGCAFHWGKAVWKKAQKLGIKAEAIRQDEQQQTFINKVLSLPFLPAEHIETAYTQLCDGATGHNKFESLLEYIGSTWISNSLWPASSWNVFMQPIRTCNDVEGWQHRLNHQLNQVNPVFYNVIWLLLQEAEVIPLDSETANEETLKKHQKKKDTGICSKIFSFWNTYLTGTMSSSTLLKKCGSLYSREITTS